MSASDSTQPTICRVGNVSALPEIAIYLRSGEAALPNPPKSRLRPAQNRVCAMRLIRGVEAACAKSPSIGRLIGNTIPSREGFG